MFGRHHEIGRKCSMGMGAREERGKGREGEESQGEGDTETRLLSVRRERDWQKDKGMRKEELK